MNPTQGIIGDTFGTDIPETQVDNTQLNEEKLRAKFSRTAEFKKLKEAIEGRILFYQYMLPDGREIGINAEPTPEDWRVANRVIAEFKAILSIYENAQEVVENATKQSIG